MPYRRFRLHGGAINVGLQVPVLGTGLGRSDFTGSLRQCAPCRSSSKYSNGRVACINVKTDLGFIFYDTDIFV